MNSRIRQHSDNIAPLRHGTPTDNVGKEPTISRDQIRLLEQLVLDLQQGLEVLSEMEIPDMKAGLDFYQEVSCFEIALIKRALLLTDGNQVKAAQLLKLNKSTLNAKVKHYQICYDSRRSGLIMHTDAYSVEEKERQH